MPLTAAKISQPVSLLELSFHLSSKEFTPNGLTVRLEGSVGALIFAAPARPVPQKRRRDEAMGRMRRVCIKVAMKVT